MRFRPGWRREAGAIAMRGITTLLGVLMILGLLLMGRDQPARLQAQGDALTVCPPAGAWALSVWLGPDDTPTGAAAATCPPPGVESAWWLNPDSQLWLGYATSPSIPEAARGGLTTVDNLQPLLLKGNPTAPAPGTVAELGQPIEMTTGDVVAIAGTSIRLQLLEAHGVPAGCFDCPITARVRVFSDSASQDLAYSLGLMPEEVLAKARVKSAFGYDFYMVKIVEGSVIIRVTRSS